MGTNIRFELIAESNQLSINEMQRIQAGKLSASAFCAGWGAATIAVGAYGWWTMTNPVGWVGAGILLGGDAACWAFA